MSSFKFSLSAIVAGASLAAVPSVHAQTLLLSLQASNYDTSTGVWSDSSGNANNATVVTTNGFTAATLTPNSTPNGSSAVTFGGSSSFSLSTAIAAPGNTGYTIFAFLEPNSTAGIAGAVISGGDNSLEYRINAGKQDVLRTSEQDIGNSNTTLSTTAFSSINVAYSNAGGGGFRLNGAADGTLGGSGISNPLTNIGSQDNGSEAFNGSIADVEVYSGMLTTAQIQTVETNFNNEYVLAAPAPEPSTWCMSALGLGLLFAVRRHRVRSA